MRLAFKITRFFYLGFLCFRTRKIARFRPREIVRLGLLDFRLMRDSLRLRLRPRSVIFEPKFWKVSCTFFEIISW